MQIRPESPQHLRDVALVREQGQASHPQGLPVESSTTPLPAPSADHLGLPSPPSDGLHLITPATLRAQRGHEAPSLGDRLLSTLVTALPLPGPQVVAMQVPMPLLGFQKPPSDIPEALWKASGKNADVAAPLAARLRALRCTEAERDSAVPLLAKLLKDWGTDMDLGAVLDAVDGKPDVATRLAVYTELAGASRDPGQALVDLEMVDVIGARTHAPLSEVGTTLATLRARDPEVGSYSPQYLDLNPGADFVLGSTDAVVRASRLECITSITAARRSLPAALEQATLLESFPCPAGQRGAVREAWLGLIKSWRASSDDVLVQGLRKAAAVTDAQAALADLVTLVGATRRPADAATDFDLAITSAAANGLERTEVVTLLKTMRDHDPNVSDSYGNLADIRGALAHVLKGDSRVARHERTQALLAMQSGGRNLAQVTPLADRVEALKCPPPGQAAIAQDLCKALSEHNPGSDDDFMAALDAIDSPEAQRKWEGFRTLLTASGRTETAASDLALAMDRAQARGIDFGEVVGQLEALRKADPHVADSYDDLADPRPLLDATLAPADGSARTRVLETLISLQKNGRNANEALPFLQEILAVQKGPLSSTAEALLQGTQGLLQAYRSRSDATLLGALKEATASPCPDLRLEQFTAHAKLTGRIDQALADLQMTREVATASSAPFDELLGHLAHLREVDPAKADSYENFAPARPAMDLITAAPDAGARQKEVQSLLSLQVAGRTLNGTVPLLHAVHGLRGGPSASHEAPVQAALLKLLEAWSSDDDDVFLELLGDVAAGGNATLEMERYGTLLDVLKRPQQALDDLRLTRELAAKYHCDQGSIVDTVLNLRKADPNIAETYNDVADIGPTLETLVSRTARTGVPGQAPSLGDAATHFLSFQRNGRDAVSAQRHATALEAVNVPAADHPALEAAYIGLLDSYAARSDDFVIEVLRIAATTSDPTTALGHFRQMTDSCKRAETARDDLKLAVEEAGRLNVPLAEAVTLITALRKSDPAVADRYESFQPIDSALEWTLQAGDPAARSDRAQRLAVLQGLGRVLDDGLKHEMRLDALHMSDSERASVREGYRKLLEQFESGEDSVLIRSLDAVDNQADAAGLMRACSELARLSRSPDTSLVDLGAVQAAVQKTGLPIEEVTSLLATVRAGDPDLGDHYRTAIDLSAPAVPVLSGQDPAARAVRAQSLARLWSDSRDATRATHGLEWILATPLPNGDMADASRKMGNLLRRLDKSTHEDDVRAVYHRMQEVAETEKVSLWRRLTRQGGVYEATVWKTLAYSRDGSNILALMQGLERYRFDGEDVGDAWKRATKLLRLDGDGYRPSSDIDAARSALEHSHLQPAWGGAANTPQANWKAIVRLTKELHSARAADAVWQCMAAASTESEAGQRREAFNRLVATTQDTDEAVRVYNALARSLAPTDAVAGPLAEITGLVESQGAELASANWIVAHESQGLSEAERRATQAVLSFARDGDSLRDLWERLQTPVKDEPFTARAEILRSALEAAHSEEEAVEVYSYIEKEFRGPGEFEQDGTPFAALVSMLSQRSQDALLEAQTALKWLRTLRTNPDDGAGAAGAPASGNTTPSNAVAPPVDPDATPLADLLMAFTSHLMMGADFNKAKALVQGEERRKKRERAGAVVAGVQVGEHEVNVGGVRIKVRRATAEA